jgi:hypothetical protein
MRDLGIADRLRGAGLVVEEQPGWQTRGSALFAPRAVMWHHTASAMGRNLPSLNVVVNGRPDLPGPLCHVLTGRDNCNVVIAAGRANHAGAGSWNGSSVGNSAYWGVEVENVGTQTEPWRPDQLQNVAEITAALINYDPALVAASCMHKEWAPQRKIDMHTISGNEMRARVMQLCNNTPPTPPTPVHTYQKDQPMFMISEGLGLFLLVNGKSCQFGTPQEFNKARESAPTIPTVVLPIPQAKALIG